MSFLVDTNILLRIAQPNHSHHSIALGSLARLIEDDAEAYFTMQNAAEFWNVATRPISRNGLGYSIDFAREEIGKIESLLTILPDSPEVYAEWKRLVGR